MRIFEDFDVFMHALNFILKQCCKMGLAILAWVVLVSLLYKVQGFDVSNRQEYSHVNPFFALLLQTFRNGFANL